MEQSKSERLRYLRELRDSDRKSYIEELHATCEVVCYPGGTTALWDPFSDTYFNNFGQQLKRPEDYHPDNDGRYY